MRHAEDTRTDVQTSCGDCMAENPKVFVVQDDLWCWHIAGPNLLCLLCAEKRLGRRFTPGDFKPIPPNAWVFETFRALSRAHSLPGIHYT